MSYLIALLLSLCFIKRMEPPHKESGERIRWSRKEKRLTQIQVADALNVSVQSVSQWETGRTRPEPERYRALGLLLDADWVWLQSGERPTAESAAIDSLVPEKTALHRRAARIIPITDAARPLVSIATPFVEEDFEEVIIARYPAVGQIFACEIVGNFSSPQFKDGDIVIFDNGIAAAVGDFVIVVDAASQSPLFRQVRGVRLDRSEIKWFDLHEIGKHAAPQALSPDVDGNRIAGVMVEHRRFRSN
jgi:transcriptional regulator with XRE-family HTH domain